MGSKGDKNKGKDILQSAMSPFPPTSYETQEAITSISLLNSTEETVVLKSLYNLCKYAQETEPNVKFLSELKLFNPLLQLLKNTEDIPIIRLSLKLLGMMVRLPEVIIILNEEYDRHPDVLRINKFFMTTSDPKIQEFASQILCKVVNSTVMAAMLFSTQVVVPIFNVLEECLDADIVRNTLEYLLRILNCQEAKIVLPKMTEFNPKVLLCYLKSDFPEIQHLVMDILIVTTGWKNTTLQLRYKESEIVQSMLRMIMDNELPDLHQKAFDVIRNCFACEATATYFIGSVEFLEFALWAKTCPKAYMLGVATIFKILTDHESAKQMLFDFSVEESIMSMFRTNNENVLRKTCQAISNLTTHKYCCEKMLTPVVIKKLIEILRRTDISTVPYTEAALKTVHDFLKRNRKMLLTFPFYGGLDTIGDIIRAPSDMTHTGFFILLDIIYRYSVEEKFKTAIMDKEIYMKLLTVFMEYEEEFSKKAIAILDQYVTDAECRVYFLDINGPEIVLGKLKQTELTEELLKFTLIFISRIFIYKKIGMKFLMNECLGTLKKLKLENEEGNLIRDRLIDMIYELYLPMKFFEKGRLEITDYIRDRFYLICGCWEGPFPFLEVLESQKLCPRRTIYVADFTAPSDLLKTACFVPRECPQKDDSKEASTTTTSTRLSVSSSAVCNILFEKIVPSVNYGGLSPDPYLTQYLEELYAKLYSSHAPVYTFEEQIEILAKYVAKQMSGSDWYPEDALLHGYHLHNSALKERLGTNMIPIGFVRHGLHCERALLFKALSDKLAMPATLVKGMQECHWNEIPLQVYENENHYKQVVYYVVDLMENVGNLMEVGSPEAKKYCGITKKRPCD